MSEKRARFIGHPDGVDLEAIPVGSDGEFRRRHIPHGGELPTEIDGLKVPAAYRDSLLEQKDNWTVVNRRAAKSRKSGKGKQKPLAAPSRAADGGATAEITTAADAAKDGER